MKITKEIVRKTAHLARLEFGSEDEDQIMNDLQKMVDWVDKLSEVDTERVEPLTTMSSEINAFRDDKPKPHLPRKDALKNAPKHNSEYFTVPKVID
ncbi:aspartyl/glutamyl-tRNA(Asn/Gln) amidotransferase subunit C [Ekhidna lutea]|uniref:Aspartyl/glutamyl-tRNA(Asn/Gln) amidotransferase subunit C n=1 Tax=Ekhidna lutea TaxID=447679 RepID=A0A239IVK0_EKHLU|nr:Asp-tRNA(Asn)/Glu-tRNA(Gln) amidotransferase subunit GatC [Ekhidna lutea]SNS97651.1 aspartyl/glutamyl-tRNA(Asn/Gln) amidotransferase subunit C [Ekhidna lutea]